MGIKTRRLILLFWSFILFSFLLISIIVLLFTLKNTKLNFIWYNFLIYSFTSFGAFLSVYIVPFIFKRHKYPYITIDEVEFKSKIFEKFLQHKIIWIIFFPLIVAILPPLFDFIIIILSIQFYNYDLKIITNFYYLIILLFIIILFIINNLLFVFFIRKLEYKRIKNNKFEFILNSD